MATLDLPRAQQHLRELSNALGLAPGDTTATLDALTADTLSILALDNDQIAYIVAGVPYHGGLALVEIGRNLANNGAALTLTEHNVRLATTNLHVPDSNLFYQTLDTLHALKSKNPLAATAFTHLGGQLNGRWVRLATNLLYAKDGIDKTIHNPGTDREWATPAQLTGPDGRITDPATRTTSYVHAYTGTHNVERVNAVLQELTGKPTHVYRVNTQPTTDVTRAAWFDANDDRSYLNGDVNYIDYTGPALGWRARKISTGNKG